MTTVTTSHATPEAFYADLTTRNRGFVSDAAQDRLGQLTVLVAGCGSTGGAAVEPLVRLGVQHFLLAEPGARVHLYGKREVRPGRKLGHVTRLTRLL